MKTATLVINDTKKFDDAVFQMQTGSNKASYDGWLQDVIKTLWGIQQYAATTDAISSEEEYTLGDVINLLDTISVRVGGSTNPITKDFYEFQNWLDSSIEEVVETMETQYCQVDDKYALVLTMEPDFCENAYEYEHTDEDGDTWCPCISLRYYSSYGCPEDWQYVRENDNQDASPIADYVVSDQKEQTEVIEWIRKDLDQHLNIKS